MRQKKSEKDFSQNSTDVNETSVLENEAVDVSELEKLETEYKDKKETRGRKPKKAKEEIENENMFAQTAVISASIGLNIIVSRLPKPIPLSKEETESFNLAFTNLAKKYYSSVQRFGEEINFSLALLFILIPRLEFKPKNANERKNNTDIRKNRNGQEHESQRVDSGLETGGNN